MLGAVAPGDWLQQKSAGELSADEMEDLLRNALQKQVKPPTASHTDTKGDSCGIDCSMRFSRCPSTV